MQANYRTYPQVIPENHAIGYPSSRLPFYAYAPKYLASRGDSKELAGPAGFSREKFLPYFRAGESPDDCIQEIIIPVRTIEGVMAKHGFASFDCLFIDCEGHEENILPQLDFDQVNPRLIVFEHTHHGERIKVIDEHLRTQGFILTRSRYDTVASR